jgi:hypothetical protein
VDEYRESVDATRGCLWALLVSLLVVSVVVLIATAAA